MGHQARGASITFLALEALPVLIIGGFTSVPGAIAGGLLVGAGEKLAEAYLGPYIGGGIEYWFAYVLALIVLLGGLRACLASGSSADMRSGRMANGELRMLTGAPMRRPFAIDRSPFAR